MDRQKIQPDPAVEPTTQVVERAAEWMAHLESGDAEEQDRADFQHWCSEHPSHAIAIERMGGLSQGTEIEREVLRRLFIRPAARRGNGALGLAIAAVLLMGGGWFLRQLPAVQVRFADERAMIGEIRPVALPDGSRMVLASNSAVDIDMGPARRTVRLLRGALLAEVAEGQATHFRVETGDGVAEALGTSFTVRKEVRATLVTVVTSKVRVCPETDGTDRGCETLSPGERVRLEDGIITRLAAIAPADATAWVDGWLPASGISLVDLLDELNRWRDSPIRFDRTTLRDVQVSGIFPLRDSDSVLANLARAHPIIIDGANTPSPLIRRKPK
jgi:transmembrane sensor